MSQPIHQTLFKLTLTEPAVGRRKPAKRDFIVMASSCDNAIEVFDNVYGAHQREGAQVTVTEWDCQVVQLRTHA
ncbi:MAG: hypothetical protein O9327_02295 [Polaromonas sp.]|nr:hypothetical protein [Polaromonas sp.]